MMMINENEKISRKTKRRIDRRNRRNKDNDDMKLLLNKIKKEKK